MIYYLGHIEEGIVDDKIRKAHNKLGRWSYGYNETYDIVIISKNGTLGSIYNINGIRIGLPAVPEHKDILNHTITKSNQRWVRDEFFPEGLTKETENESQYANYINAEFKKREEGVWLYIKGQLLLLLLLLLLL